MLKLKIHFAPVLQEVPTSMHDDDGDGDGEDILFGRVPTCYTIVDESPLAPTIKQKNPRLSTDAAGRDPTAHV
jgi:hypothetical protein